MNTSQLAGRLAAEYDVDENAAANTVETYIRQIEKADGRSIDRDHISEDDAETVTAAFDAGVETLDAQNSQFEDELIELSQRIELMQEELAGLTEDRNRIINRLLDRAVPVNEITSLTGLSRARIYAIRKNS